MDVEITKKVFDSCYIELMTSLPMDDIIFLALLKQHNLLPADLKEQVKAKPTRAEKTDLFLEKAIECSLGIGNGEPFNNLLTVMSDEVYVKSEILIQLAGKIKQELNEAVG